MDKKILQIEELTVSIAGRRVIDGVSLGVAKGEVLALVGESGSGKTLTGLAVLDLLPDTAVRECGKILLKNRDIFTLSSEEKRKMRGRDAAMVFQEPFTSMNPVMNVGRQMREAVWAHFDITRKEADDKVKEFLHAVKLSESVVSNYPHELSGGMRQRIVIAMALVCDPEVLILDEPTTALDVSIQKEVLDLVRTLQKEKGFASLFITHDFSVVNMVADTVAVMKEGKLIECGPRDDVLRSPREKYTKRLIECVPRLGDTRKRLTVDV